MTAIELLKKKIAITQPFADNENYDIGLTIKEGNAILTELEKQPDLEKCLFCNDTGYIPQQEGVPNQMCPHCKIGQAVIMGYNKANSIQLGNYDQLQGKLKDQEARIKELEEALRKYSHHSRLCKVMQINRNLKCDCGLEAVLGELEKLEKNGTAPDEYMHESIKKDAVKYDLPPEEIIQALALDNEQLQAKLADLEAENGELKERIRFAVDYLPESPNKALGFLEPALKDRK